MPSFAPISRIGRFSAARAISMSLFTFGTHRAPLLAAPVAGCSLLRQSLRAHLALGREGTSVFPMSAIAPDATCPGAEPDSANARRGRRGREGRAVRERHFYFVLLPNFTMIAFAMAIEPLRIANRMAGKQAYRWSLVSLDGLPAQASNGIQLNVDMSAQGGAREGARRRAAGPCLHLRLARGRALPRPQPQLLDRLARSPEDRHRRARHRRLGAGRRRAFSTAAAAPSTGNRCPPSPRGSRRRRSMPTSSRSTAIATPAPAAPPRST